MRREITVNSREETIAFARDLASQAKPGDVYCLVGELGAGKTVIAKGMGEELGVPAHMSSPTFTFLNIYDYPGQKMPLYHFDLYRITSLDDMDDIGYEECFYGKGASVVEWADQARELMPPGAVWIMVEKLLEVSDDCRRITVDGSDGLC
jgi:tRNA threonylcarbamoyladenosine biosynthesis protein TsaE